MLGVIEFHFILKYLVSGIVLVLVDRLYLMLAKKYSIVDRPNNRSSHRSETIRGGGIIFPISIFIGIFFTEQMPPGLAASLFMISMVSFLDDLKGVPVVGRLVVHLASIALMVFHFHELSTAPLLMMAVVFLILGWINAFNFMDGINGITSLYSIVCLATFLFLNSTVNFIQNDLLIFTLMGVLVFSWSNVRKKAVSFAGDVGSVSLAFMLGFLMLNLIVHTGYWTYILFFCVYGIDAGFTLLQRLLKKQNVFRPHRTHLYQYLANEAKFSHLSVSTAYALFQLLLNVLVIAFFPFRSSFGAVIILIILSIIYLWLKHRVIKSINITADRS